MDRWINSKKQNSDNVGNEIWIKGSGEIADLGNVGIAAFQETRNAASAAY